MRAVHRPQRTGDRALVRGIEVGMQQTHGDRVGGFGNPREHAVERGDLAAPTVQPPRDPEAEGAGHERRGPVGKGVVQRRTGLTGDLDLVGETVGRDQRDAGAATFEQRVRRDRRAVGEHADTTVDRADCARYGPRRIVGRGSNLRDAPVVRHDIGERATAVNADPHACER